MPDRAAGRAAGRGSSDWHAPNHPRDIRMNATSTVDINLATAAANGDSLLPRLNALREVDPIFWSDLSHCWIVTGHEAVTEGFSGTLPLLNGKMESLLQRVLPGDELRRRIPNTLRVMPRILPNLDGPEHARLRKLFVKAFSRKLVEDVRPYVRERIDSVLDRAAALRDIEFNEGVARQIPGAVILRILGMPETYIDRLKWWTDGTTQALVSFDPSPSALDTLESVIKDMIETFTPLIEARRKEPRADFLSALVHASEGGVSLGMDELIASLNLLVVAGHDTTSNSMTLGIRALASQPQAWEYIRDNPDRSVNAGIELMRYVAMSAVQPRLVDKDFEWRGRRLKQNDVVMLFIAGGNRDSEVYPNPEQLDFSRTNDRALTFGPGVHHCIGHMLAKLQMGEFLAAATQRFERIEVLEDPSWVPNLIFRSVNALKVRFHPRA
jgi:pimeloyl-[acyl-carrier protein] synthase